MADHVLMSKHLKELDEVIGCAFRKWIVDENVLLQKRRTSFFLTGTVVSANNDTSTPATRTTTTVWRFSPSIPILYGGGKNVQDMVIPSRPGSMLLTIAPLLYNGQDCRLLFNKGELLAVRDPTLAPFGVWISQPNNDVKLECGDKVVAWPVKPNSRLKRNDVEGER